MLVFIKFFGLKNIVLLGYTSLFMKFNSSIFFFFSLGPKSKSIPKREKTKEEKTLKRKGKYFVAAQLVAVVVFLTLMVTFDITEGEVEDVDAGEY
jgi:hypothetical protein